MDFPIDYVRGCFADLNDSDAVGFDGISSPRPLKSVRALGEAKGLANGETLGCEVREALAAFLNSNAEWAEEEILLASSYDELARRLGSALVRSGGPGGEIVTTELDDETSLGPWRELEKLGQQSVRWPVKRQTANLDGDRLQSVLSERTRAVFIAKASAPVGSIVELLPISLALKDRPASLVVHWSAFLPHGAIDVRFLRADFVIASTRMFLGTDVAFLWGSRERMAELRGKAPELFRGLDVEPEKVAGLGAALRYVEELGRVSEEMQIQPSEDYGRRRHMRRGMQLIRHYERVLSALLLRRIGQVPNARILGVREDHAAAHRLPNVLFTIGDLEPVAVASGLADRGIHVGHGNMDSPELMSSIGLSETAGGVCASLLHYNTESEIERFSDALHDVSHLRS